MKTASELGIPENWHAALVLVRHKLASGELQRIEADEPDTIPKGEWFNMNFWNYSNHRECGTVRCIGGWCEAIGGFRFTNGLSAGFDFDAVYTGLQDLFYPADLRKFGGITVAQAVAAIDNYLETGEAKWKEVLAVPGQPLTTLVLDPMNPVAGDPV